MCTVETLATEGVWRLRLVPDEDAGSWNPRTEWDHLESVVTVPDGRYADIDKDGGPLDSEWRYLVNRYQGREAIEIFTRYATIYHGAVCLEEFTGRSGPNAVWYLTREQYSGPDGTPDPLAYLKAQAEEYAAWAEGDVWGYIIEREVTWTREDDPTQHTTTWETEESCWGFIGYSHAEQAAREAWAHIDRQ